MPHLRELVKLHADEPFALVGVNTGDTPEAYRKGLKEHGVSWISAYQGSTTPIAKLYQVRSYPTYYLIDAEGEIVDRGNSAAAMDAKIEMLLAGMKKD